MMVSSTSAAKIKPKVVFLTKSNCTLLNFQMISQFDYTLLEKPHQTKSHQVDTFDWGATIRPKGASCLHSPPPNQIPITIPVTHAPTHPQYRTKNLPSRVLCRNFRIATIPAGHPPTAHHASSVRSLIRHAPARALRLSAQNSTNVMTFTTASAAGTTTQSESSSIPAAYGHGPHAAAPSNAGAASGESPAPLSGIMLP